jgi:predicted cupin superfamily sugar epimerase
MPAVTAYDVIKRLALEPHPEGGFFRETFRDTAQSGTSRAASTAIYFLLPQGVISRWHKVDAAEVWHYYAGAPLALDMVAPGGVRTALQLGADLVSGERPQGIVPANHWQQARSLGAWTLVGCTVAPGFEFAGFEMAPPGFLPA